MLKEYMEQLSKDMEVEGGFKPSEGGNYTLRFGEDFTIDISEPTSGGISFTTNVAPCPRERQEAFFTSALLGNLFGQGTRGGILGLNEEGSLLTLTKTIEYNIDYKEFKNQFEDYINAVDFWREEALTHR